MTTKRYITWSDIETTCKTLASTLRPHGFKKLLVVTRGGMAPASILIQHLNIKHIDTIGLQSYIDKEQTDISIIKSPSDDIGNGEGWLILDELVDSGATVKYLRNRFPSAHIATLYEKPDGHGFSDTTVRQLETNEWLVMPWEKDEN